MIKKWKQWTSGLTYRTRIAGCLLLTLALLFSLWAYHGYPLPTAELEFRRLERTNLLPRSEIVFTAPRGTNDLKAKNSSSLVLWERWVVGTRGDRAAVGYLMENRGQIDVFPLDDGPSPLPLWQGRVTWIEQGEGERGEAYADLRSGCALLFLKVPQAARGELVLDVTYQEQDCHRVSEGWDLGEGIWLFALEGPQTSYAVDWYQGGRYTLTLYREDGSLLLKWEGIIPSGE